MEKRRWAALSFRVPLDDAELLSYCLHESGTLGVVESATTAGTTVLTAYFAEDTDTEHLINGLSDAWQQLGQSRRGLHLASREWVESQDWVGQWRDNFQSIRVGDRFLIVPSWHDKEPESGRLVVKLDPQNAFGSGSHASTRLCLLGIADHYCPPDRALDIGTGSGILAIAMAKMQKAPTSRRTVTAIDCDSDAVATARQNAARNGVREQVRFVHVDFESWQSKAYPFIVANLTTRQLHELAPRFKALCSPSALVLLSGLQCVDLAGVRSAYRREGFRTVQCRRQEGWSLLVLRAPHKKRNGDA